VTPVVFQAAEATVNPCIINIDSPKGLHHHGVMPG
jgi:hypothetical protein